MDEIINVLNTVSSQLLPILGVIVLILLAVLLRKLTVLVITLNSRVKQVEKTIDLVDESIEKAQAPLDSAVKLSKTVDEIHDKSYEAVKSASSYVMDNMNVVKDFVSEKINKNKASNEDKIIDDLETEEKEVK